MAKYKLTSHGELSVACDILNESEGQYIVRFKNGVVRNVNKEQVSDLNRVDEAVLDRIRDFGRAAGDVVRKGVEKVKEVVVKFSNMIADGFVFVVNKMGEVINASGAINVFQFGKDEPIAAIPGDDVIAQSRYFGLPCKAFANYRFTGEYDGFKGLTDFAAVEESTKPFDVQDFLYEAMNKGHEYTDYSERKWKESDYMSGDKGSGLKLKSDTIHRNLNATEISDMIVDEYLERFDKPYDYDAVILPLRIWGAPGIGKSAMMKAVREKIKAEKGNEITVITINANSLGSHDIFVTGIMSEDEGKKIENSVIKALTDEHGTKANKYVDIQRSKDLPKSWLPVYEEGLYDNPVDASLGNFTANGGWVEKDADGNVVEAHEGFGGIIFIDEFSRLNPIATSSIMQLPSERKFGISGMKIGSRWVVVCAANRLEDMGKLAQQDYKETQEGARASRFTDINYMPVPTEWFAWAEKPSKSAGTQFHIIPEIIAYVKYSILNHGGMDRVDPQVAGAMSSDDKSLDQVFKYTASDYYNVWNGSAQPDNTEMPLAMPRTWEAYSNRLASIMRRNNAELHDLPLDVIYENGASIVGEPVAARFTKFISNFYKKGPSEAELQDIWLKGAHEIDDANPDMAKLIDLYPSLDPAQNVGATAWISPLSALQDVKNNVFARMKKFKPADVNSDHIKNVYSYLKALVSILLTTSSFGYDGKRFNDLANEFDEFFGLNVSLAEPLYKAAAAYKDKNSI